MLYLSIKLAVIGLNNVFNLIRCVSASIQKYLSNISLRSLKYFQYMYFICVYFYRYLAMCGMEVCIYTSVGRFTFLMWHGMTFV